MTSDWYQQQQEQWRQQQMKYDWAKRQQQQENAKQPPPKTMPCSICNRPGQICRHCGLSFCGLHITPHSQPSYGMKRFAGHYCIPPDVRARVKSILRTTKQTPPTPKALGEAESRLELIKKLAELRDAGILTEEEFRGKKKKLLEKI